MPSGRSKKTKRRRRKGKKKRKRRRGGDDDKEVKLKKVATHICFQCYVTSTVK
jgi:hypothetical protein